jgi:hypothetical protein
MEKKINLKNFLFFSDNKCLTLYVIEGRLEQKSIVHQEKVPAAEGSPPAAVVQNGPFPESPPAAVVQNGPFPESPLVAVVQNGLLNAVPTLSGFKMNTNMT